MVQFRKIEAQKKSKNLGFKKKSSLSFVKLAADRTKTDGVPLKPASDENRKLFYEEGLAYGARTLRFDGARERTHRRMMRLYYLAGDRTDALRQYDRCVAALRRELGVSPSAHTVALYNQIRRERLHGSARLAVSDAGAPESHPSQWSEVIEKLKFLQAALVILQRGASLLLGLADPPHAPVHVRSLMAICGQVQEQLVML